MTIVSKLVSLSFIIASLSSPLSVAYGCYSPRGIDEPDGISSSHVKDLLDGTALGDPLPYLFLPMAGPLIDVLKSTFETPIQFRQALYHGNTCYNAAAMIHSTALDIWGLDDYRVCSDEFSSEEEKQVYEEVALAYTFALSGIEIAPDSSGALATIMNKVLNLPLSKTGGSKLEPGTPWWLAKVTVDRMVEYAKSDGWNYDGSLSLAYNRMPYQDFEYRQYSPYKVKRNNQQLDGTCVRKWHWEPLLETNYNGYFTKQEFVTPFAGFTGRLYGMTKAEYKNFSVVKPDYDYCSEADFVLSETKKMATDEKKKAEIEFFDSKFTSILPMQIEWSIKKGLSSFDFWFYDMALVTAMYDATMLVWREKVAYNAVRPTTVVHTLKGEEPVETYAGPFEGTPKMIKGNEWQPYIRTMPHAEYPSGSSCICTAYAEAIQILSGEDDTGFPVGVVVEAGSSKSEPGVAPSATVDLFYNKWSEVQHACGQSRIYGGMHFSKAIPAGEELCSGVASLITGRAELLKNGDVNGALADLNDTTIKVKRRINNNQGTRR